MKIPENRIFAAFWTYQCSIFASLIMIMSVPYNAVIIAHEKMTVFAYISVLEVVLKFVIAYLLLISPIDRLIFFSLLIVAVQALVRLCYTWYCNKCFCETKSQWIWDSSLIKEMVSFAGWNLFGSSAFIAMTQGLNVLLNMFFGPIVNASRAIAVQAQSALVQFVSNFQMAVNPQIVKSYASKDLSYMHNLICQSSKLSFFLFLVMSLPILIETPYILKVWLAVVPENTVIFLRLMICTSWITTLSNPLINAVQASGKIRFYQSLVGTTLILILPFSYVCLKIGMPAYSVFIIHLVMEMTAQAIRLIIVGSLIELPIGSYVQKVFFHIFPVCLISFPIPVFLYNILSDTTISFLCVCVVCVVMSTLSIWYVGLETSERKYILNIMYRKLKKQ